MKKLWRFGWIAMFVIILAAAAIAIASRQENTDFKRAAPEAVNGMINLNDWDLGSDGSVRLNGVWEFYWGQLLSPDDFHAEGTSFTPIYAEVPNVWTEHELSGESLPGFGYGTYRLRVHLGEINSGTRLGLHLPDVSKANTSQVLAVWIGRERKE